MQAARKHQEIIPASAGTQPDRLHPSSSAQRLQQHGAKSKSRSWHHTLLNRRRKPGPCYPTCAELSCPHNNPASGFWLLFLVCYVFPRQANCKHGHEVCCGLWFNGSTSPEVQQQTAQLRAFSGRTTCTITKRRGPQGFCRGLEANNGRGWRCKLCDYS